MPDHHAFFRIAGCSEKDIQVTAETVNSTPIELTTEEIFAAHEGGKLTVGLTAPLNDKRDLSIAYTPGVAQVSRAIHAEPELAQKYTWASRLVAVVSDGTAVLGLGNIGASASLPVMEGKAALFQKFAGLDSIPLVIESTDVDEIVETVVRLRSSFGAVNLEDISAPRCFEIEERLIEALDMPVMHDDQHGTAVVVLAALTNAAKFVQRELSSLKVVVSGAGAAGIAVAEILMTAGISDVTILDSKGIIHSGRQDLSGIKATYAERTNPRGTTGGSAEALEGADVFVGVSAGTIPEEQLAAMSDDAIVFALSNPDPEVHPEIARRYAKVVATGRSDFPNQINNVLAFPGIFRGALDSGAKKITSEMKVAAAQAIADIAASDLSADYIVPSPLDPRVAPAVTAAVSAVAEASKA
ncbi:NADP-dependent malic enzyme [Arthrobacter sp. SF27]|nr:NADP-dependent malic enzyme [Arthrobacter sp. SF27]NMR28845.1 NADP-dependent malic enzyme [Arthrobacter sp. SF27]